MKIALIAAVLMAGQLAQAQSWRPAPNPIMTRWAAKVDPAQPLPEYPRPQMVRPDWQNLNGLWSYSITTKDAAQSGPSQGEILAPFPLESALSGVKRPLQPSEKLWYRRTFRVPAAWNGKRLLLHFGAVDWHAAVTVNGRPAGEHKGGYTPFSFDITSLLKKDGDQEVVVAVTDPTDSWTQPRGKQIRTPGGIWYTSVSGIWQTVWLEPVPETSVARVVATPDLDRGEAVISTDLAGARGGEQIEAVALDGAKEVGRGQAAAGSAVRVRVSGAQAWSPESPKLYDLRISLTRAGAALDTVTGYFAMRKISLGPDEHGRTRILLNNKPYFQLGPLDQGWWPDGLYTVPTDEALRFDIEFTKRMGLNLIRKHVKVEPARWYYHCDRIGMLVWQDMPNGNLPVTAVNGLWVKPGGPDAERPADSAAQFETELKEMVRALEMFPSIVVWVPFNEGWGQYDTLRVTKLTESLDRSRLVNSVSGWTDREVGAMRDVHHYPGPAGEAAGPGRAMVLGEFGGISMPVEGHLWTKDANWGYATRQKKDELFAYYQSLFRNMRGLLAQGLSAAIYTQTTDVESEVNGYITYDRAVEKFDAPELRKFHQQFYAAAPKAKTVLPDSREGRVEWRYVTKEPGNGWETEQFSDATWMTGAGAFLSANDTIFPLGTKWDSPAIWLRRTFDLAIRPRELFLSLINGFSEGEVYINGTRVLALKDVRPARRHHTHFDLTQYRDSLRLGKNTIAIRASQPEGVRSVDAGLYGIF